MIDLDRLRILHAVATSGSLSAAARALGSSQPAVSHHVRALEREVGTPLVARAGRGVRLTAAGEALAGHAAAILDRLAVAEEEVAALAGLRAGRVRVAAFPSAAAALVPPALAALAAAHPGLAVTLVEAEPPASSALVRDGEVDLALGFTYDDAGDPSVTAVPLARDDLATVLPPGHGLAGREAVDVADLAAASWIAGCPRCRDHLLRVCDAAGFAPRITFETDDYVAVQGLVARGLGVALLPRLALRAHTSPDVVVRRVLGDPARTLTAVIPAGPSRPPATAALLAALRAAARQ